MEGEKVSPINGQPLPRGKPFTSESAREARRKRTEKEKAQQTITAAFKRLMNNEFCDLNGKVRTGAEIIAESILSGATKGIPKMVEIALDIMGEKPSIKLSMDRNGSLADLIDGLKEPIDNDLYAETAGVNGTMEERRTQENQSL